MILFEKFGQHHGITDRRCVEEARCDLAAWIAKWGMRYPRLARWVEEIIEKALIFCQRTRARLSSSN
jgi:transposase-like protein